MINIKKHLYNLFINWGGHIASMVVLFFLSPYIVSKLDASSYGIWTLLNVLVGYMGIFDLGIRASVGRHIALYLGKKDTRGVDETIRSGFGLFTIFGIIILMVGILLGWLFPTFFRGIALEHYATVRYLLPVAVLNIWLSVVAAIYSCVLTSLYRFDVARGIDLFVLIIRTAGTIFALQHGFGLWGLIGAVMVANFCAVIANRILAAKYWPNLRSLPLLYSKERFRELFGYGAFAFISSAGYKIIGQTDLIIVGAVLSVADVREYSVGAMLVYYTVPFISMISSTFFPLIQRTVSSGLMEQTKELLYHQLRISLSLGLIVYIGIAFYSRPFIRLWMYQDGFDMSAVAKASTVMIILALSKLPTLYLGPCKSVLDAMGFVRFNAARTTTEAVVNIAFSLIYTIVLKWGLMGVAAGTLTARLLVSTVSVPVFLSKKANIPIETLCAKALVPGLLSGGIFALTCAFLTHIYHPETWTAFIVQIAIASLIWGIIIWFFLLPSSTRRRIRQSIPKYLAFPQ